LQSIVTFKPKCICVRRSDLGSISLDGLLLTHEIHTACTSKIVFANYFIFSTHLFLWYYHTEVYLTFSRLKVSKFQNEFMKSSFLPIIFWPLTAKLSESAENFRNILIKIQPQTSFDLNDLKRPNWEFKEKCHWTIPFLPWILKIASFYFCDILGGWPGVLGGGVLCIKRITVHAVFGWDAAKVETVQDFLIKLGIKPLMHLLEISIFSLNEDIIRVNKIMNNLVKDLKILSFKVNFQCLKLVESFQKKISVKNIWLGDQLILMKFFENFDF
jgi:hypothetical protein